MLLMLPIFNYLSTPLEKDSTLKKFELKNVNRVIDNKNRGSSA